MTPQPKLTPRTECCRSAVGPQRFHELRASANAAEQRNTPPQQPSDPQPSQHGDQSANASGDAADFGAAPAQPEPDAAGTETEAGAEAAAQPQLDAALAAAAAPAEAAAAASAAVAEPAAAEQAAGSPPRKRQKRSGDALLSGLRHDAPQRHKAPDGRRLSELSQAEAATLLAKRHASPPGASENTQRLWLAALRAQAGGGLPNDHPSLHFAPDGRPLSELPHAEATQLLARQPKQIGPPTLWMRALKLAAGQGRSRRQPADVPPLPPPPPQQPPPLQQQSPQQQLPPQQLPRPAPAQAGPPAPQASPAAPALTPKDVQYQRAPDGRSLSELSAREAMALLAERHARPVGASHAQQQQWLVVMRRLAGGGLPTDHPSLHFTPEGCPLSELPFGEAAQLLATQPKPRGHAPLYLRALRQVRMNNKASNSHSLPHFRSTSMIISVARSFWHAVERRSQWGQCFRYSKALSVLSVLSTFLTSIVAGYRS